MVDAHLIRDFDISDAELDAQMAGLDLSSLDDQLNNTQVLERGTSDLIKARVIGLRGGDVLLDVGLKSEALLSRHEWDEDESVSAGDEVEVIFDEIEPETGLVIVSKRKADRMRAWNRIAESAQEGDIVEGRITREIKGGLLVDIGVPVFMPASQLDIRRPAKLDSYIGKKIEAKILRVDTDRRNIVISRRKLLEEQRAASKEKLLSNIEVGQTRKGMVKNITSFGAFIDLGGIDGLLHITDMAWDRVDHPSEVVKVDQEIEVMVLNIDLEKERIALGLKQKTANPWESVAQRYPVGNRVKGEVTKLANYGAFVKLEPGVEGLVHISEMSWTKRVAHPSDMLTVGQEIEVIVLDINPEKQEISLGLKQTESNPWDTIVEKYPPGTLIEGTVRSLTNYGAFVEIEPGIDGLLHVNDFSWSRKVSHPSEEVKVSDQIKCVILSVDREKARVALGLKQLTEDPWERAIPERYQPGMVIRGKVTKIANFGVFVELEPELEGLLHISELADEQIDDPEKVVKVGEEVDVKILRVDTLERKIGLSKKRADWSGDVEESASEPEPRKKLRGGLGDGQGDTLI
ncbi:MAG: 30S ribosomal protein S1 [Phycisphaerales bacterium]|nr:30S ribosomal protein S1 [Phycisphaerales bacterium]